MISLALPHITEDSDPLKDCLLMQQRLNSLSPASLERLFSRLELQSGLIRFEMKRPEHKLRDLARNLLGLTEESLGELNIVQVSKLFYDRRMTFSLDQVANVAVRRLRKHVVARLLSTFHYQGLAKKQKELLFLVHDDEGAVKLLVMKDEGNFFPCTITPLSEEPLFDGPIQAIILRHPNPHLYWMVSTNGEVKESGNIEVPRRIGQKEKISLWVDPVCDYPAFEAETKIFMRKIEDAYNLQNLEVKIGFGIHNPHWEEGNDQRSLFGFPEEGPQLDSNAVAIDAWMYEMRGLMACMCKEGDIPPPCSLATMRQRDMKLEWMRESGLTFSIRDMALFMHNVQRLPQGDKYELLAHDEGGLVYLVRIGYRDQSISNVTVGRANLYSSLHEHCSSVKFCIRTYFTDGILSITQPSLSIKDAHGKEVYEAIFPSSH